MTSYPSLGSVISGTMRPEDLIPAFMDALDNIREELARPGSTTEPFEHLQARKDDVARIDDVLGAIEERMNQDVDDGSEPYFETEGASWDLDTLENMLNEFAPPYCYFGSHEGDGADYGFWISWESLEDDCRYGDVLRIDAGDEWPEDEIRDRAQNGCIDYILEVNDHGNATLCGFNLLPDGRIERFEVWSVV